MRNESLQISWLLNDYGTYKDIVKHKPFKLEDDSFLPFKPRESFFEGYDKSLVKPIKLML